MDRWVDAWAPRVFVGGEGGGRVLGVRFDALDQSRERFLLVAIWRFGSVIVHVVRLGHVFVLSRRVTRETTSSSRVEGRAIR